MHDKKSLIIETARHAFIQQGYRATSIQSIADACSISKGSVYLHFRSKQEILMAIIDQIDQDQNHAIRKIQNETHLLPKERLKKQILFLFSDTLENRAMIDLFSRDSGLELTDELFTYIDEIRYRWQKLQEEFLLEIYGPDIKKWVTDLTLILNGLINEYSMYIYVDKVDLDIDQATNFVVFIFETLTKQLKMHKPKPALTPEQLPDRTTILQQAEQRRQQSLSELLNLLKQQIENLAVDPEEKELLQETQEHLVKAVQNNAIDKAIIRGLLASLREHKALNDTRENLARILKVKLV